MSDRLAAMDREAMRALVRQVLRDVLPEAVKANASLRAAAETATGAGAPAGARTRAQPRSEAKAAKPAPRRDSFAAHKDAGVGRAPSGPPPTDRRTVTEEVALHTDQDLAKFVRRLSHLLDDPADREAVRSGRHAFRLKRSRPAVPGTMGAAADPARPTGSVERIAQGVVKENTVIAAAKAGARLVIGKGVVVTPLARDKARQLGVQIERDA